MSTPPHTSFPFHVCVCVCEVCMCVCTFMCVLVHVCTWIHMYVCGYVCTWIHVYVCGHVYGGLRLRLGWSGIIPPSLLHFVPWRKVSQSNPELAEMAGIASCFALGSLLLLTSEAEILRRPPIPPVIYMGARDPYSSLHACWAWVFPLNHLPSPWEPFWLTNQTLDFWLLSGYLLYAKHYPRSWGHSTHKILVLTEVGAEQMERQAVRW